MIDSLRPLCADILSGLAGKSSRSARRLIDGADTLRWVDEFDDDAAARARGYASIDDLEEERDDLTDQVGELTKQAEDTRFQVIAVDKILKGLPALIERVAALTVDDNGEVTDLVVAVDEARRAIKAAAK